MRRIVLVVFVSIALPLAGCTDTTPVNQGSGEGVLIFNLETGDEQQVPDVRIDFTPEPDSFGAIMTAGDVAHHLLQFGSCLLVHVRVTWSS